MTGIGKSTWKYLIFILFVSLLKFDAILLVLCSSPVIALVCILNESYYSNTLTTPILLLLTFLKFAGLQPTIYEKTTFLQLLFKDFPYFIFFLGKHLNGCFRTSAFTCLFNTNKEKDKINNY